MANNTHCANDYHQPTPPCILVMDWIPKIQVGANFLMINFSDGKLEKIHSILKPQYGEQVC